MTNSPASSSHNELAQASLARSIQSFNRWRCDTMSHMDAAIEADPGYVKAQAAKGLMLMGARHVRFLPVIEQCLQAAQTGRAHADDKERHYLDTLTYLVNGRTNNAVKVLTEVVKHDPTDLFAHRVLQQELFWMGEFGVMRDVAESALPAWSADHTDYGGFLSVLAFGLEESGDLDRAEHYGREAVSLDATDLWGTHAVAHALEMQHRSVDGVDWLKGLSSHWEDSNQIKHHLWWHLCLFLLEQHAHDEILTLLRTEVRNEDSALVQGMPDAYIDLQNVASLLLRLELRGVDTGDLWHTIADHSAGRIDNHASPFTSAHAAMALAAADRMDEAHALVASMQAYVDESGDDLVPRFAKAGLPAAKAAIAHRRRDYQAVVDILKPAMPDLWCMGGSHAQRDVFTQILFDACLHLRDSDGQANIIAGMKQAGFADVEQRTLYSRQQ